MERIALLLEMAGRESGPRPERSMRYAALASRIAMRYNVRLPGELKRNFCKQCHMCLAPGSGCRVRIAGGRRITTCLHCGHVSRAAAGKPSGQKPE